MRVVLAALLLVGCGQAPVGQLDSLVAFLRDVHPEPHRHVAAAELDALVAGEQSGLGDAPDALALAAATQRVVAALGDAHLVAGLAADGSRREGFPLQAVRAGDTIFVDASEPALPLGTELVSVEGRPAAAFLRDLSRYASIDGDRPAVRLAEAERRFAGFATLELGRRERYAVEVRRPGEGVTALTLNASSVDLDARRASAPRWGRSDAAPWPSVHAHDAWTILRLPGFGVPDEEGYAARVDAIFAELAPDAPLALDLRGNEGGIRAHGVAVLRHLLAEPFAQWTRVETRVRAIPDAHAARVGFPIAPREALTGFPGARVGDRWVFEGDPMADRMIPTGAPHEGAVAVLVDDATSSAAVELVAALLAHREGVLVVGTETQGECGRHTGQLPVLYDVGAGVSVLASLFEITLVPFSGCEPGRGVVPDVEVRYERAHFLEARDPFLEALAGLPTGRSDR